MFQFLKGQLGFTSVRLIVAIPILLIVVIGSTFLLRKLIKSKFGKQIDLLEYDFDELKDQLMGANWIRFKNQIDKETKSSQEQLELISEHEQLMVHHNSGVSLIKEFREHEEDDVKELSSLISYVRSLCDKLRGEVSTFLIKLDAYMKSHTSRENFKVAPLTDKKLENQSIYVEKQRNEQNSSVTKKQNFQVKSFGAMQAVPTATLTVPTVSKSEDLKTKSISEAKREFASKIADENKNPMSKEKIENQSISSTRQLFEKRIDENTQGAKKEINKMEFMNDDVPVSNPGSKYASNTESVIGEGVVINGDLSASTPLVIGGRVAGTISSNSVVALVAGAEIEGDISATSVLTEGGVVQGNITSHDSTVVDSGSFVIGNIEGSDLTIKGDVHGNITSLGEVRFESTAQVVGDIKASSMDIKKGPKIRGTFIIGDDIDF